MKNILKISACFIASLFIVGCSDDEPEYSNTPELEFVSISPSSITEFQEEVAITIKYRDGDGDLGENDPDVKNLYVTDQRNGVKYSYRVPELSPSGSVIAIEGNLEIDMNSLSVVGSGTSESAIFDVYIVDRAGNQSNVITTSAVTVSK